MLTSPAAKKNGVVIDNAEESITTKNYNSTTTEIMSKDGRVLEESS